MNEIKLLKMKSGNKEEVTRMKSGYKEWNQVIKN